ncbi:hypothetical protein EYF80_052567 [Liparis tanakae]|uniref:Uncharacterized protein n=1 Tax=Liparis tanakae TaxID=230148 RepID=A0A4Z2F7Z7_9TELE|nr:hypothetical protein EYF80_052567 [Liparis tanakae]
MKHTSSLISVACRQLPKTIQSSPGSRHAQLLLPRPNNTTSTSTSTCEPCHSFREETPDLCSNSGKKSVVHIGFLGDPFTEMAVSSSILSKDHPPDRKPKSDKTSLPSNEFDPTEAPAVQRSGSVLAEGRPESCGKTLLQERPAWRPPQPRLREKTAA